MECEPHSSDVDTLEVAGYHMWGETASAGQLPQHTWSDKSHNSENLQASSKLYIKILPFRRNMSHLFILRPGKCDCVVVWGGWDAHMRIYN